MALALISAVAMMASFEAYRDASTGEKLLNTAFVLVSAAIALWSMRRYLYLLMHAEEMANQANCPQCEAYGLLTLQDPQDRRESAQRLVPVCCKRCGFRWNLEDG